MSLLTIPALPLLLFWFPWIGARIAGRNGAAWAAALVAAGSAVFLALSIDRMPADGLLVEQWSWMPTLGLTLGLRLDGLAQLMASLILGIGLLVILYGRYYLAHDDHDDRFYAFLLIFMGAMLGVVMSENLLGLVVFWELTSVSSFLLVAFKNDASEARRGARRALGVTGLGGLGLIGAALLLGDICGSYELSVVLAQHDRIVDAPTYPAVMVLLLLGIFTKSAQFPFHFWLPGAMSAPTPASAYLHSATMVKAGVFLLARLWPALAGTDLWFYGVGGFGMITLIFGAWVALFQHDLKGLLAYSTISHLGLITALFGLGTPMGVVAGIFHLINHATFKASLFMAAGIIDHETGTRDIRKLGGIAAAMPLTAGLATIAAGAMAGVPLLNGFLSKEMFFKEAVEVAEKTQRHDLLLPIAATVAGILSVAYSLRFIFDTFFGKRSADLPREPHPPPLWMQAPVALLVVLCVAVGLFPAAIIQPLLKKAGASVLGAQMPSVDLHLWHGFNLPLVMSLIALAVGGILFAFRAKLFAARDRTPNLRTGAEHYSRAVGLIYRLGRIVTETLHDRNSLRRYVIATVLVCLGLGVSQFRSPQALELDGSSIDAPTAVLTGLLVLGALATTVFRHRRLVALISLALVGLASVLLFVEFSAPDLALTQLGVEFATTILMLLALAYLPQFEPRESSQGRILGDVLLSALVGLGLAALAYAVITRPFESIADFYVATTKPYGGGTNIVNVILVDFRGFDTMGEVTVLGIAALAISSMLRDFRLPSPPRAADDLPRSADRFPFVLRIMTRPLLPLLLLVGLYLMLRGHNLPGGGFVAGLVTGLALILQGLASGVGWATAQLRASFVGLIALGLAIAAGTGLVAMIFGAPFLTSAFTHVHWGPIEFELASAMAFDLGVFLVVVAVLMLIVVRLAEIGAEASEESAAKRRAGLDREPVSPSSPGEQH